jgi:hypothetical protein
MELEMGKKKWYIGITGKRDKNLRPYAEIFFSFFVPSKSLYPEYQKVVGPFYSQKELRNYLKLTPIDYIIQKINPCNKSNPEVDESGQSGGVHIDVYQNPVNLSSQEKILFSSFKAHERLSKAQIPGYFAEALAELEGKNLIFLIPGSGKLPGGPVWEITPTGRKYRGNPPLPASALLDLSVARSLVREAGEDWIDDPMDKHIGRKIGKALPMMEDGLKRIEESHRGQIDFENPPLFYDKIGGMMWAIAKLREMLSQGRIKFTGYYSDKEFERAIVQLSDALEHIKNTHLGGGFIDNPPLTEIYKDIIEIRAKKRNGKLYRHPFELGSGIYGLSDGSILVKSRKGKRLWKNFPKGKSHAR